MPTMNRKSAAMCRNFQNWSALTSAGRGAGSGRRRHGRWQIWRGAFARLVAPLLHRGADEVAEERVRPVGTGAQLRVKLRAEHERVVAQLTDLDQRPVRRDAAGDESTPAEDCAV